MRHMCKNTVSYEHNKNRNRAVARFRFFVANAKKENEMFYLILFLYIQKLRQIMICRSFNRSSISLSVNVHSAFSFPEIIHLIDDNMRIVQVSF